MGTRIVFGDDLDAVATRMNEAAVAVSVSNPRQFGGGPEAPPDGAEMPGIPDLL